ncbi:hypothetical protein [uncultured Pontibacter sp.]|uniref:hypothetical protein n=1 Tax=uncultured Pontibacter sp. TaxID=453356 RepID=UPI002602CEE4|nr:hypothetical protein [uncultured Pontibacter sp.]
MKHIIRCALLLVTFLSVSFSCEKCNDLEVLESTATLRWSGDYAVDGCGYSIQLGENTLKPDNEKDIDDSFKTDGSTTVRLKYVHLDQRDFQCGMVPVSNTLDFIRIISIEKL